MKRIFAASAAALISLALGGAALACAPGFCEGRCTGWYPGDPNGYAACMNGCTAGCKEREN